MTFLRRYLSYSYSRLFIAYHRFMRMRFILHRLNSILIHLISISSIWGHLIQLSRCHQFLLYYNLADFIVNALFHSTFQRISRTALFVSQKLRFITTKIVSRLHCVANTFKNLIELSLNGNKCDIFVHRNEHIDPHFRSSILDCDMYANISHFKDWFVMHYTNFHCQPSCNGSR